MAINVNQFYGCLSLSLLDVGIGLAISRGGNFLSYTNFASDLSVRYFTRRLRDEETALK